MSVLETFEKSAVETYTKQINYTDKIPAGLTVASVAVSSIDLLDGSTASVVSAGAGSGASALFTVTGGTDGHEYLLTITSTLSGGTIISDQLILKVINRAS